MRQVIHGRSRVGRHDPDQLSRFGRLALLLDDAHRLASSNHGFTSEFFDFCRSQTENQRLIWVSTARDDLFDLFHREGMSSTFLNGARKIWLGLLTRDEVIELGFEESIVELVNTLGP